MRPICQAGFELWSSLTSASWVARITGVSHQCPTQYCLFF
jgi:hypothetical protein